MYMNVYMLYINMYMLYINMYMNNSSPKGSPYGKPKY